MLRTAVCRAGSGLLKQPCQNVPVFWGTRAQQQRWASSLPMNTVILFVPQQEAWVVERLGRFHRILDPGLNLLIPILDRIRYVQSLKEIMIYVPEQSAVSLDNVKLQVDGVLHMRILDPFKASYGVEDLEYAVTQLAQTTMRSELGKFTLNEVLRERESLKANILHLINLTSDNWGIRCLRYEIKDIDIPPHVQESMQMPVVAEWKKRGMVVESEGMKESAIIVAEGCKQAQIIIATGEAIALLIKAEAKAKAISILADELSQKSCWSISNFVRFVLRVRVNQNGNAATSLAKRYISAFSNLEKTPSNTIILPSNTGDVSRMVTQATAIYGTLSKTQSPASVEVKPVPADDDFKFKPLPEIPSPESTSSQ